MNASDAQPGHGVQPAAAAGTAPASAAADAQRQAGAGSPLAGSARLEQRDPIHDKAGQTFDDGLLQRRRFDAVLPLVDFKERLVAKGPLWQALVDATREVLDPAPSELPLHGLIVADDPLLGLAAAQLFAAPVIGVPLERQALRPRLRIAEAMALHGDLGEFVLAARSLNAARGPQLMLGWNAGGLQSCEATLDAARHVPALADGFVWLVQKDWVAADLQARAWDAAQPLPVVADVAACARDILAKTLPRLQLPEFIDVSTQEQVQRLIDGLLATYRRLGRLLEALNTPSHGEFQRLVSRLTLAERPAESQAFKEHVLNPREDQPRHAASLFLVAHFADLTPAQFVELGDALAASSESFQLGPRWRRPPAAITDVVLDACGIRFDMAAHGRATAVLGSETEGQGSDPLGVLAAEHMRRRFDLQAPLLKERLLRQLDAQWLLSHTADTIADPYCDLVVASLRAHCAGDAEVPAQRLRRIVYGPDPQAASADAGATVQRLTRLALAMTRAPRLIELFAIGDFSERLHEAVAALCGAGLFPTEQDRQPLLRHASAGLFWLFYGHFKGRLNLDAFPSLFGEHSADDALRRLDCLNQLRRLLHDSWRRSDVDGAPSAWLFATPQALSGLVSDIGRHYWQIVGNGHEWVDVALLAEAGCSYLRQALRSSNWLEVAAWITTDQSSPAADGRIDSIATAPGTDTAQGEGDYAAEDAADDPAIATHSPDLALARALLGGRFMHWLLHPALRPPESDGTDPFAPTYTSRDAGRLQRRIVHAVLDALVGLRSFSTRRQSHEQAAINIWFRRALMQPRVAVYYIDFSDERLWQALCSTAEETQADRALLDEALTPVLRLFPLFLLMACTRNPGPEPGAALQFRFSAVLRNWLQTQLNADKPSPAQVLMRLIESGFNLQQQWKLAHDEVWLAEDIDWQRIAAAMQDREDALHAFAAAVAPIADASRPLRDAEATGAAAAH